MPTSPKVRHRVNLIPVSQPICQLRSLLTSYTEDDEAFAMLNATKTNDGVQSMAAQSGFTANECHYILMMKDKVYYDCYIREFIIECHEYSFDYLITITNQFTINVHT